MYPEYHLSATLDFVCGRIAGPDDDQILVSVADPPFITIQNVSLFCLRCSCLEVGGIRPNLFLSKPPTTDNLESLQPWQILGLLFLTTEKLNGGHYEPPLQYYGSTDTGITTIKLSEYSTNPHSAHWLSVRWLQKVFEDVQLLELVDELTWKLGSLDVGCHVRDHLLLHPLSYLETDFLDDDGTIHSPQE
jgi:hypothetical protein